MIDWGGDVIIGHHPHDVQGIERYKNGVIFYSLGNFNFINSSSMDRSFPCTRWGLIVLLRFSQSSSVEYLCLPVRINEEYQPEFPPEDKRQAFLAYLEQISKPLTPAVQPWFWFRRAAAPHFRNHLPSFVRRIRLYGLLHLYQMVRWLISPSNYGFYLGLILHFMDSISGRSSSIRCPEPYDAR
jgi:poly-gamma-glutamate synthesis protein (capsule biosynthesis protein)